MHETVRRDRRRTGASLGAGIVLAGLAVGLIGAAGSSAGQRTALAALDLNASLSLTSGLATCPPGSPADVCAARTIAGPFRGLGHVSGAYTLLINLDAPCEAGLGNALAYPIRFTVASKGEIHAALDEAPCVEPEAARIQTQTFTITGGTGVYAGATGSGTVSRVLGGTGSAGGGLGRETWIGTLSVPGLEFDTTRPTLAGATTRKVRAAKGARSARVRFTVTARDDEDGAVPVLCDRRSGARFRIGKTRVTCSATDRSANSSSASFTITVLRRR